MKNIFRLRILIGLKVIFLPIKLNARIVIVEEFDILAKLINYRILSLMRKINQLNFMLIGSIV
jgi:hypothetical protein